VLCSIWGVAVLGDLCSIMGHEKARWLSMTLASLR